MPAIDAELAARAKRGSVAAYEQLVRAHWEGVYRVAYAILGDPDQAEDAAQECFLRAYAALSRFDERREFTPWIRRIAANCAISAGRERGRAGRAAACGILPAVDDPADVAAAGAFETAVKGAIAQLPNQQRAAIQLFALEDIDLAATAETMGCAEGTVKVHLRRARRRLRELLSDFLQEGNDIEV